MTTRKRRIVFDLDETIVHYPDQQALPVTTVDTFRLQDGAVMLVRSDLYRFLRFVVAHFDEIYVFTAASELYAREVIDVVFKGVPITKVWTKKDCFMTQEKIYKVLSNKYSPDGECIDTRHTIILDDRYDVSAQNVYARNVPGVQDNHIVVPQFTGAADDGVLIAVEQRLQKWIQVS